MTFCFDRGFKRRNEFLQALEVLPIRGISKRGLEKFVHVDTPTA
jgi:hypothetical protein